MPQLQSRLRAAAAKVHRRVLRFGFGWMLTFCLLDTSYGIGPLAVDPSGRHLVDEQMRPFFWMADTAWPLFTHFTRQEAEAYLDIRARQGFTVVQAVVVWGLGKGRDLYRFAPAPLPNREGQHPFLDAEAMEPNEAYFQGVDHLLSYANERGMVIALLPVWGNAYVGSLIRTEQVRRLGEWLGQRYRHRPNLVWVMGGDDDGAGKAALYREFAMAIQRTDQRHLLTYHPNFHGSSSRWFHAGPWLAFHMIQTWAEMRDIPLYIARDRALHPSKPTILAEGAYEDCPPPSRYQRVTQAVAARIGWMEAHLVRLRRYRVGLLVLGAAVIATALVVRRRVVVRWGVASGGLLLAVTLVIPAEAPMRGLQCPTYPTGPIGPLQVRRQAWWATLSGSFYTHGHTQLWSMIGNWERAFESPGASSMEAYGRILRTGPWWMLEPDQMLLRAGAGSDRERPLHVASRSRDRTWALLYFSAPATATLDLTRIAGARHKLTWIEPANGSRLLGEPATATASATVSTPQAWPDALLLVEARSAALGDQ